MSTENGLCNLAVVPLHDTDQLKLGQQTNSEFLSDSDIKTEHVFEDCTLNVGALLLNRNGALNDGTLSQGMNNSETAPTATNFPGSQEDLLSGISKLCSEHNAELDWYCSTEGKTICSLCFTVGPCQDHKTTPLINRGTKIRNQLVDVCEKMQLQALRIERFISQTLTAKERALQADASSARERVIAQVNAVREALEEEEQRLLEAVQREEERVEQCLLTQKAHWSQALDTLTEARTSLVHTLTHSPDAQLVNSNQEIYERIEEAEGAGEPKDTEHLNLNGDCSDSKLMLALWASATLLGPSARGSPSQCFDDHTVSPLLSVSDDRRTLTFLPKRLRQTPAYNPARFDSWPNALCSPSVSSGTHRWVLNVGQSAAFKVGVCYASMERKGSGNGARLGYNAQSWVLSRYVGDYSFCHAGKNTSLGVVMRPCRVGLLLDWPCQTLLFYDPDSSCVLHTLRHAFSEPLQLACAVADQSVTLLR